MNMLSFYGGPAGKDFTIAKIFDSKASLDADIAAGDASEIYAGDYVLVSYGDPNTPEFSTNRQKDEDKSYNATLWKKDWNNGYEYHLICDLTVDYPLFVAGAAEASLPFGSAPQLTIDSSSLASPKVGLKMPASLRAGTANTTESVAPTATASIAPVYGGTLGNELSFQAKVPQGVTFTPSVSDAGEISWTNNGNLPNPATKSVKGLKGDNGDPGIVISATQPTAESHPVWINPEGEASPAGVADISLSVTGATVGQIAKITAVDDSGKPTAWEAVDMPSGGGGGTKMEEVTETVTVGSENVTLDSSAPSQTVNLAWNVPSGKTIPAFTNYYIEKNNISYPRTFATTGYTQTWSNSAGNGNGDTFVSGHQYFQAMYYRMDGDSSAVIMSSGLGTADYITPTNSKTVTGSGWIYMLATPSTGGSVCMGFNQSGTGTGTIDYLYCIDVTALQEAGTITATTVNELAELFGGLELIPGQDYAGSTTSGMATLSITRDGETTTVDSGTATATVQGGDILSVDGGSVTFLLKVLREVYVDSIGVWSGKKWVAFGDSLTDETINADKKYYRYIEEKTGITVVVMGAGGTGYYKGYDSGTAYGQRMANVPADADVITIFGSVNDWHTKSANVEMGNASDTMEAGTLAGYINECIDVAIEKAPYAQIALVTPMDYSGLPSDTLEGIANIIKAVAAYRQIKCLDLYHESGFRVDNPTFAAVYTTDYSETAEIYGHPSNLAHEQLIAPEFMELLKRMLLTA